MTAVQLERLPHAEGLPLPAYETDGSAGMDLRAAVADDQPLVLEPGGRVLVPTGFRIALQSGFEAQVRAVLGMPLTDWKPLHPCAMVNYVGVDDAEPDWAGIDALEGTRVHLYHKAHRHGRKLGHVNLVAPDVATLRERLVKLESLIT